MPSKGKKEKIKEQGGEKAEAKGQGGSRILPSVHAWTTKLTVI